MAQVAIVVLQTVGVGDVPEGSTTRAQDVSCNFFVQFVIKASWWFGVFDQLTIALFVQVEPFCVNYRRVYWIYFPKLNVTRCKLFACMVWILSAEIRQFELRLRATFFLSVCMGWFDWILNAEIRQWEAQEKSELNCLPFYILLSLCWLESLCRNTSSSKHKKVRFIPVMFRVTFLFESWWLKLITADWIICANIRQFKLQKDETSTSDELVIPVVLIVSGLNQIWTL